MTYSQNCNPVTIPCDHFANFGNEIPRPEMHYRSHHLPARDWFVDLFAGMGVVWTPNQAPSPGSPAHGRSSPGPVRADAGGSWPTPLPGHGAARRPCASARRCANGGPGSRRRAARGTSRRSSCAGPARPVRSRDGPAAAGGRVGALGHLTLQSGQLLGVAAVQAHLNAPLQDVADVQGGEKGRRKCEAASIGSWPHFRWSLIGSVGRSVENQGAQTTVSAPKSDWKDRFRPLGLFGPHLYSRGVMLR